MNEKNLSETPEYNISVSHLMTDTIKVCDSPVIIATEHAQVHYTFIMTLTKDFLV